MRRHSRKDRKLFKEEWERREGGRGKLAMGEKGKMVTSTRLSSVKLT